MGMLVMHWRTSLMVVSPGIDPWGSSYGWCPSPDHAAHIVLCFSINVANHMWWNTWVSKGGWSEWENCIPWAVSIEDTEKAGVRLLWMGEGGLCKGSVVCSTALLRSSGGFNMAEWLLIPEWVKVFECGFAIKPQLHPQWRFRSCIK